MADPLVADPLWPVRVVHSLHANMGSHGGDVRAIETMTSQGSPYARFRRALTNGNPLMITAACAELPRVSLADALEVCLAFRDVAPDRYGKAIARWLARYVSEQHADDAEAAFLLACLRALTSPSCAAGAAHGLQVHLSRGGLAELATTVERWALRSGLNTPEPRPDCLEPAWARVPERERLAGTD